MRKPLEFAELEWDKHDQPRSTQYGDIYFSSSDDPQHNGLAESRYIFLQHNRLEARWQTIKNGDDNRDSFVIGETGFGTGLNFLATWALWDTTKLANTHLHYISIEKHPLRPTQLARAVAVWPELQPYAEQLLSQYPSLLTHGFFSLAFPDSRVWLTLIIDDVENALSQCLQSDHPYFQLPFGRGVDAWYLDGFAPRLNPAMWSEAVLQQVARLSREKTTLATFTAAGSVQRQLRALGFTVEKFPGFGHKREMLNGVLQKPIQLDLPPLDSKCNYSLPWSIAPTPVCNKKEVTIIGAGLAGCHSARALANRGWRVQLIEAGTDVATGASGNAQGIVYAKLSADDDPAAQFNLSALLVAGQIYHDWWQSECQLGQQCGVLQLAGNPKQQKIWQQCRDYFGALSAASNHSDVQFVTASEASDIAGIAINHDGMFFPHLGWLNPALLCSQLVDHPSIELQFNTQVAALDYQSTDNSWTLLDQHNQSICQTPVVVIANAHAATQFWQTEALPLKQIRGQVSYLPADNHIEALQTVVCGERYIAPVNPYGGQLQTLGASFNLNYRGLTTRALDHQSNIAGVTELLPSLTARLSQLDTAQLQGRAHFRCTTPDYLPLVGPVHDYQQFLADYPQLRIDATTPYHQSGCHWPGLYLNVGHGSRGLAYTPFSARLLASLINGDPLPLSRRLYQALHPGRFTIRGLIRGRL